VERHARLIGDSGRCRPLRPIERAARRVRPRFPDLAISEQIQDRRPQFRVGIARRHHAADLVAVIDPAGVADPSFAVDEHNLRRDRRVEGLGQREVGVEPEREREAKLAAVGLDLANVVDFTDHAHEADAFVGELVGKSVEHRGVILRQRTGGMEKREAHSPAIVAQRIRERDGVAGERSESETFRWDRRTVGRPRCGGDQ
jgi:hypothetical protein